MSSYENLPKVGGDCNGVKHADDGGEEDVNGIENGNVKDDPDHSYVFVSRSNSPNYDPVDKDLNSDCADETKSVPKSSQIEDAEVQVGELNGQNGENTELCGEDNCIVEGADNSPSNSDIVPESSLVKPDGDDCKVAKTDAVEEQNGTLAVESSVVKTDGDDCKVAKTDAVEEQNGTLAMESSVVKPDGDDGKVAKSDAVEEQNDTLAVVKPDGDDGKVAKTDTVEEQNGTLAMDSELQLVDGEVKVEKESQLESGNESMLPGGELKAEEQIQSESVPDPEENQGSPVIVSKAGDCESQQLDDGIQNNLESTAEVDEVLQSQTMVSEADHSDDEKLKSEEQNSLESTAEVDEVLQSQTMVSEADHSDDEKLKPEEPNSLESTAEVDEVLQSQTMVSEADHSDDEKLKSEEPNSLESTAEVDEVLQSQTMVSVADRSNDEKLKSEERNNLDSTAEVHEVPQSQTSVSEADHSDDEKVKSEDKNNLEPIAELDGSEESLLNEEQDNLKSTAVTQKSRESEIVGICAVEPQLSEVEAEKAKSEEPTELGSAREVEESLDSQITVSESAASESCQLDNGEEKLVEEKKTDFGIDMKADQQADILVTDSVDGNLDQGNESANITNKTDVSLETEIANDSVSDAMVRLPTSHVEDGISQTEVLNEGIDGSERPPELNASSENAEILPSSSRCMRSEIKFGTVSEGSESFPTGSDDSTEVEQEVECGSSLATDSFPTCSADDIKSENEVENLNVKSRETILPCPVDDAKSEIEEKGPDGDDRVLPCPVAKSEIEENGPDGDDRASCPANDMSSEIEDDGPEVVNIEKVGGQFNSGDGDDDDKIACQETKGDEGTSGDGFSTSSPEDSSADAIDERNVGVETRRRPFRFLIRIPRYDDENIREQIGRAQLQLDEKTQLRDAIRVEIQTKRANCEDCYRKYDAAKLGEIAERGLLRSKFQEIESIKSVLNRVKSAISVEDIDGRIQSMEHMIEHETMPLKEEKQFIREIKQLKQLREQHSSNMMSSQDEVHRALDDSVQMEERLKILKKEVKSLKDKVSEAKVTTDAAEKIYFDENKKVQELKAKFRAADGIRQEAYAHLQRLRKQLYEKNKHFRMYKDDVMAANDCESSGNREALYRLCVNQVERFMELWNKDDEFRRDYVKCNTRSTLRRLNTLDGRSLGPDEEPPVLPNLVNERVDRSLFNRVKANAMSVKANAVSVISTIEQVKQGSSMEGEAADGKAAVKVEKQKNQAVKTKEPAKPVVETGSATVSGRVESEETKEEEPKQTKEEQELARKAEELRKAEAAAKLREQRRLEEKAKAKEALERKKRNVEKAQMRAELRAQKEAEQKEKEREKKARKKERKKGVAIEATDGNNEGETAPTSENPIETTKEPEMKERAMSVTKRPQKPSRFTKQSKVKSIPSIPPPLRNKGKRKMQTWMWVILAILVVLALFLLGNIGFSFDLGLQRLGF
ncbi:uncharacterized protein LOC132278552 isoform X2 [Cornus florida]|nr:uncharacterized protein LOC132278552 isoform X2 [Cornus florida]